MRGEDSKDFFFKAGDRVLFLGDSITEQYQYSTDIELNLTTRFPNWNCLFLNAGTATGGAGRFATHVLAEKPTAIDSVSKDVKRKQLNLGWGALKQFLAP